MEAYNRTYICKRRNMEVSLGYCERCYCGDFHNGSRNWYNCVSRNITSNESADIGKLITELRLQEV